MHNYFTFWHLMANLHAFEIFFFPIQIATISGWIILSACKWVFSYSEYFSIDINILLCINILNYLLFLDFQLSLVIYINILYFYLAFIYIYFSNFSNLVFYFSVDKTFLIFV